MSNPFRNIIGSALTPVAMPAPEKLLFLPEKFRPDDGALVVAIDAELNNDAVQPTAPPTVTSQDNPAAPPVTARCRASLKGGIYDPANALMLLSSHYFIAKANGAYVIAQIEDDGSIKYISDKDFRLKLGNMFIRVDDGHGGKKKVGAEKFWISHPDRDERQVTFDPKAPPRISVPGKHNLWGGFAVTPQKTDGEATSHNASPLQVICRKER